MWEKWLVAIQRPREIASWKNERGRGERTTVDSEESDEMWLEGGGRGVLTLFESARL